MLGEKVALSLFLMDGIVHVPDFVYMIQRPWKSSVGFWGHVYYVSPTDLHRPISCPIRGRAQAWAECRLS